MLAPLGRRTWKLPCVLMDSESEIKSCDSHGSESCCPSQLYTRPGTRNVILPGLRRRCGGGGRGHVRHLTPHVLGDTGRGVERERERETEREREREREAPLPVRHWQRDRMRTTGRIYPGRVSLTVTGGSRADSLQSWRIQVSQHSFARVHRAGLPLRAQSR